MPTSLFEQWPEILRLAARIAPLTVLDVGPGYGKAGVLLREKVSSVQRVDAVEAHCRYIRDNGLHVIYDGIRCGYFEELTESQLRRYDLVLMVDVIEHIEEGMAVPALRKISTHLLVCTPSAFEVSWVPGLPETERHVSCWEPWMVEKCGFATVEVVEQYAGWVGLFTRDGDR